MTRDSRTARPLRRCTLVALIAIAIVTVAITETASGVPERCHQPGVRGRRQYRRAVPKRFRRAVQSRHDAGLTERLVDSYTSATGTGNFSTNLTPLAGTLAPGQYYLIQLAVGANLSAPLPSPDATGATAMSATGGKVVLVNTSAGLACNGGSAPCDATQLAQIVDLVGWDGANFFETAPAPTTSNTTAVIRGAGGCTDTDSNAADFVLGAPAPRNTASPVAPSSSTCPRHSRRRCRPAERRASR